MNIGQVAAASNLPTKTIRYYEDIGLITPKRGQNGYRVFQASDVHKLAFIARARALGFTIDDCRKLLALYDDKSRESAAVKGLALNHLAEIEEKIAQLKSMRDTLASLINACAGDHRPNCPILADLQGGYPETGD